MSDAIENAVEQEEEIDQQLTEAVDSLESDDQQALDSEESTQEAEEVDLSDLDLEGLAGTHPEEERKRNNAMAKMRIRAKAAEAKLNDDSFVAEPQGNKPKRVHYLNPETVDEKFQGSEALANAAFEDAMDDYRESGKQSTAEARSTAKAEHKNLSQFVEAQEEFEGQVAAVQGSVKNIDSLVAKAEDSMFIVDSHGNELDGSMVIKMRYKEDAPLMMAALGSNPSVAKSIMAMPDQFDVIQALNRLRDKVRNVKANTRQVSSAPEDTLVKGSNKASMTKTERLMEEAADAGNYEEYNRLRNTLQS